MGLEQLEGDVVKVSVFCKGAADRFGQGGEGKPVGCVGLFKGVAKRTMV
jgi:hypothetical protein